MKVNYKTHPILEMLNPSLRGVAIRPFDSDLMDFNNIEALREPFQSDIVANIGKFSSRTTAISKSFHNAIIESSEKLRPIFLDRLNTGNLSLVGTYVMGEFTHMINCNFVDPDMESERNELVHYVFLNTGQPVMYSSRILNKQLKWVSREVKAGKIFAIKITTNDEVRTLVKTALTSIALVEIFKEHAEVEIKTLSGKTKDNTVGCQYNNGTKSKVTFLDSKWFTTLVKSDAFKVRGHFRLQPYGEGMKLKKLIWINDFEKSGYTAPARKLKEG